MTWQCPICNEELGELNAYCEYCKMAGRGKVYNPDNYFIREIRISHISQGAEPMTPQEEKFAKLFNGEKVLVKDMDTLTLRAHREELADIAFTARACLTAVDDEIKEREKKDKKAPGFSRSVNTDETTTNAINTIKERQKNLTGKEKMLQNLIDLYMKGGSTKEEAEQKATTAMGAGKILEQLKKKQQPEGDRSEAIIKGETIHSPLSQENGFVIMKQAPPEKPVESIKNVIFNPFAKKTEGEA